MVTLTAQFEVNPPWLHKGGRYPWAMMINPSSERPEGWENTKVLARLPMDQRDVDWYAQQGAAGAQQLEARYGCFMDDHPYVWGWCTLNEPVLDTPEQVRNLAEFYREHIAIMQREQRRVIAGNFGNGAPKCRQFDFDRTAWPILAPVLQYADGLGLHEYGKNGKLYKTRDWFMLRYRWVADEWEQLGLRLPPLFITETGHDQGGGANDGWQTFMNAEEYMAQLYWLYDQWKRDGLVTAGFIFAAGAGPAWPSFNFTEAMFDLLIPPEAEIPAVAPLPPAPVRPPVVVMPPIIKPPVIAPSAPWDRLYLHHCARRIAEWQGQASVDETVAYWRDKWGDDGHPHFIIGPDGSIWPTWPMERDGVGVYGREPGGRYYNERSRHIELWLNAEVEEVPTAQWLAAVELAAKLLYEQGLGTGDLRYHAHNEATACPGRHIIERWEEFRAAVSRVLEALYTAPAHEPLPSDEAIGDTPKLRWWLEQSVREIEMDTSQSLGRARAILLDAIKWLGKWPARPPVVAEVRDGTV